MTGGRRHSAPINSASPPLTREQAEEVYKREAAQWFHDAAERHDETVLYMTDAILWKTNSTQQNGNSMDGTTSSNVDKPWDVGVLFITQTAAAIGLFIAGHFLHSLFAAHCSGDYGNTTFLFGYYAAQGGDQSCHMEEEFSSSVDTNHQNELSQAT